MAGLPRQAAATDKRFRRAQVKPSGRQGVALRRAVLAAKLSVLGALVATGAWRTITGCNTPLTRIDSASSRRRSASK